MTMGAPQRVILAPVLALLAWALAASAAAAQQRVGVSTAVNPDATGTAPGGASKQLLLGQNVVYHERIVTTAAGQTQILFVDESAMTIAPNSDLTIDEFVYNPDTGKGQLAMSAVTGVMRFVGGKLSKNENAVTMTTPTGRLGIRGGVFMMDLRRDGHLDVIFLYGKSLTVTGTNGVSQTITRPGFAVSIPGFGASPLPPGPPPPGMLGNLLAALAGHAGSTAGSKDPPTDASVANSGIASTISGNVNASIQAANQGQPPSGQPQPQRVSTIQSSQQVSSVQAQPVVVPAITQAATEVTGVGVFPIGIGFDVLNDGTFTPGAGTAAISGGRLTITPLSGSGAGIGATIPAIVGLSNFGPPGATNDKGQPITGTLYLSSDLSLFYGYGSTVGKGIDTPGGKTTFVFGGAPTVSLPTMGIGTYSGNAFGGVFNNGVSYVASGAFGASYNFGSASGTMTISGLDGHTFGGPISGAGGTYTGSLSGGGLTAASVGLFFGPSASTTGGLFEAVSTSAPTNYHITGVFGGVRQ